MKQNTDFTKGKILGPLLKFMIPVFFALFLQAMYGAVDLMIVGRFGQAADVSAVSTGSQIMMTITHVVSSFAMGTTILLGRMIGQGDGKRSGSVVGASVFLFSAIALVLTVLTPLLAGKLAATMNAPAEASAIPKHR